MDENTKIILNVWKKASEYQDREIKKICKKYKVKFKSVQEEEDYCVYQFENGVEFSVPYSDNFEDYDLTGDALEFAERHYNICDKTFFRVEEELEKEGFVEWDSDIYFKIWKKDDKEYNVPNYVTKEEDIEVSHT